MEYEWELEVLGLDHRVGFAMGLVGPLVAAAAGAFGPGLTGGFLTDGLLWGTLELGDSGLFAGQQAEIANPPESFRNQVAGETAQEGAAGHGHLAVASAVPVILPREADAPLDRIDPRDAAVAYRDAAGVARQIAHHRAGVAQGRPGEDVPVAARQIHPPASAGLHRVELLRPLHAGVAVDGFQLAQEDRPEHPGHREHVEQIGRILLAPPAGIKIHASRAYQHVEVGMPVEGPAPGVKHRQESALHPPVVLQEQVEGFRHHGEKQVATQPVVQFEELVHLGGQGEDEVEMGAIRQPLADLAGPAGLARPETVGAVAVAARTGVPFHVLALVTAGAVVSQGSLAALGHQVERRILLHFQTSRPEVAPFAQDRIDGRFHAVH